MKINGNKLALRRQSIRTLSDSELRIAYGGNPSVVPGTNRTVVTGTSVVNPSGGEPSGGIVLRLPKGRFLNPSGGRQNPSGGSIDLPSGG